MLIKLFEEFGGDIFDVVIDKYFKSKIVEVNKNSSYGYQVSDDKVTFGCKLTYEADISYLFHEMGHFVYFKDLTRLLKSEYGLNYPKVEVYGNEYDLASNWTDIKNEARVSCFQYMLLQHFKQNIDMEEFCYDWVSSLRLLDGFTFVPIKGSYEKEKNYYDIVSNEEISFDDIQKRKIETIIDFFKDECEKSIYNINEFDKRWFERIKYLEDNLKIKKFENMKYIKSINEFYSDPKIYYRGVGEEEAIKSLEVGHLIYYSQDAMSSDWEVIEYGLGSEASEMSEDEISEYVKELIPWEDIDKGVNLTTDIDNAFGYGDIVFGVEVKCDIAEFSKYHHFAEDPNECIIKEMYYKGREVTKEELLQKIKEN